MVITQSRLQTFLWMVTKVIVVGNVGVAGPSPAKSTNFLRIHSSEVGGYENRLPTRVAKLTVSFDKNKPWFNN